MKTPNSIEKLTRRYVKKLENGCWDWTGCTNAEGYGSVTYQWRAWLAHRIFYTELKKPIQKGYDLHHKCGNRTCVNPDHLAECLPRQHPDSQAMKTHCKRGHEFTPENTAIYKRGSRQCRSCRRIKRERHKRFLAGRTKTEKEV